MVSAETEQAPSAEAGVGIRSSSSGTVSILSRHSEGSLVAAGTVSSIFEAAAAATFAAAIFPACAGSTATRPQATRPKKNCFITARLYGPFLSAPGPWWKDLPQA